MGIIVLACMTKNDISNFLTENCTSLKRKFSVEKIGLFGSYAKGAAAEESDMDIIVDMPFGFDLYYDLKEFLEKTFQKKLILD